jgi:predicted ribosomally synthesized peptide with SipW-like signal peptide
MKKIIGLTIAAIMVVAVVGIGTWAYFSDTETSTGNTFTAGTLNLVPLTSGTGVVGKYTVTAGGDGVNGNVTFTNIVPGESGSITWTLNNTGTIAGNLTMTGTTVSFTDGVAAVDPETSVTVPHANNGDSNGDLDEFVGVNLQRGAGNYILGAAGTYVPFSDLQAILAAENQSIASGGSLIYIFNWSVATDIVGLGSTCLAPSHTTAIGDPVDDNIIQGDTANLSITFTLTQS